MVPLDLLVGSAVLRGIHAGLGIAGRSDDGDLEGAGREEVGDVLAEGQTDRGGVLGLDGQDGGGRRGERLVLEER